MKSLSGEIKAGECVIVDAADGDIVWKKQSIRQE